MLKCFLLLFFPSIVFAQITHRDLLQKNCPASRLKEILVSHSSLHPFPQTAADWKKVLPDSILHYLMQNGETALIIASSRAHKEIVEILLNQQNININAKKKVYFIFKIKQKM